MVLTIHPQFAFDFIWPLLGFQLKYWLCMTFSGLSTQVSSDDLEYGLSWAFDPSAFPRNWLESAHDSSSISETWIDSTHDSSVFLGIDSESTHDSSRSPTYWSRSTHGSKCFHTIRFESTRWLKLKAFDSESAHDSTLSHSHRYQYLSSSNCLTHDGLGGGGGICSLSKILYKWTSSITSLQYLLRYRFDTFCENMKVISGTFLC